MSESTKLSLGADLEARDIAIVRREGGAPGLFWLGGYRSDMTGEKASAIDRLGAEDGLMVTRFDYSGHGASGGDFENGTIGLWLQEAVEVFATTRGPQIVIGSSMGGWLALLLNAALREAGDTRIAGLVLIAPAVDMTEELMRKRFTPAQLHELHAAGRLELASDYDSEPNIVTEKLILDGAARTLLGKGSIRTHCPVAILQGGQDTDVPPALAMELVSHITLDPLTLTLVPDGDHRLSRDRDLEKLCGIVREMVREVGAAETISRRDPS